MVSFPSPRKVNLRSRMTRRRRTPVDPVLRPARFGIHGAGNAGEPEMALPGGNGFL